VLLTPAGFISTIAGWIVAEAGRQPWVITDILRISQSISNVRPELVLSSFSAFLIVYPIIFITRAADKKKVVRDSKSLL
jgi:cytochrome d ubiquinol oxidase subunit I